MCISGDKVLTPVSRTYTSYSEGMTTRPMLQAVKLFVGQTQYASVSLMQSFVQKITVITRKQSGCFHTPCLRERSRYWDHNFISDSSYVQARSLLPVPNSLTCADKMSLIILNWWLVFSPNRINIVSLAKLDKSVYRSLQPATDNFTLTPVTVQTCHYVRTELPIRTCTYLQGSSIHKRHFSESLLSMVGCTWTETIFKLARIRVCDVFRLICPADDRDQCALPRSVNHLKLEDVEREGISVPCPHEVALGISTSLAGHFPGDFSGLTCSVDYKFAVMSTRGKQFCQNQP